MRPISPCRPPANGMEELSTDWLALSPIALTYDDGPNDPHTRACWKSSPNTAFRQLFSDRTLRSATSGLAREIVHAGHAVGNHTFTHPLLTFKSETEITRATLRLQIRIARSSRPTLQSLPPALRRTPPGRAPRRARTRPQPSHVERNRLRLERPTSRRNRTKSRSQIRGGDVILLHDGGHKQMGADRSQTVIATDSLITRYKKEGYEFVTIPQMMAKSAQSRQPR